MPRLSKPIRVVHSRASNSTQATTASCRAVRLSALAAIAFLVGARTLSSQEPARNMVDRVGFDQRIGAPLPLELEFRDSTGNAVQLKDYFDRKPVILALVYYECPMLCSLVLDGLVESLRAVDLSAGRDFEILTVSFDPSETHEVADARRDLYLSRYNRAEADRGWHFLTGDAATVERLCQAVGFRYQYDAARDVYAHPSGIVLVTSEGTIARYMLGIDYAPRDLKFGLVETSNGTAGSPVDQLLLMCYGYDPATGKYGFLIMTVIRASAAVTIAGLAGFIGVSLIREFRRRRMGGVAAPCGVCEGTRHT